MSAREVAHLRFHSSILQASAREAKKNRTAGNQLLRYAIELKREVANLKNRISNSLRLSRPKMRG